MDKANTIKGFSMNDSAKYIRKLETKVVRDVIKARKVSANAITPELIKLAATSGKSIASLLKGAK